MNNVNLNCKLLDVKQLTSKKGNLFFLGNFAMEDGTSFKCLLDKFYALPPFSDVELTFEVNVDYNQNLSLRCNNLVLASK